MRELRPKRLSPGTAILTLPYAITQVKAIVHVVGPRVRGTQPNEVQRQQLASCYIRALDMAKRYRCKSVALPCISTGISGFPRGEAAVIAVLTFRAWLEDNSSAGISVIFCVISADDLILYHNLLN